MLEKLDQRAQAEREAATTHRVAVSQLRQDNAERRGLETAALQVLSNNWTLWRGYENGGGEIDHLPIGPGASGPSRSRQRPADRGQRDE
jgi:hypothetical protein